MSYSTFTVTRTFWSAKTIRKRFIKIWHHFANICPFDLKFYRKIRTGNLNQLCYYRIVHLLEEKKILLVCIIPKRKDKERRLVKKFKILVKIRSKPAKFYRKNSTHLYNWHVKFEHMLICTFSKFELKPRIFVNFHQKFSYLQTIMKKFHHFVNFKVKSLKFWLWIAEHLTYQPY